MASALQTLAGGSLRFVCTRLDKFANREKCQKKGVYQARCALSNTGEAADRVRLQGSKRRAAGRLRAADPGYGGGQTDSENGISKVSKGIRAFLKILGHPCDEVCALLYCASGLLMRNCGIGGGQICRAFGRK